MTHSTIHIDRVHGAAIRREFGDRLRMSLDAERVPLPPHLQSLLARLAVRDRGNVIPKQH